MQINRARLRVVVGASKGTRKYSTQIQMWGWAAPGPSFPVPSAAIPSQAGMPARWVQPLATGPLVKRVSLSRESGSSSGLWGG